MVLSRTWLGGGALLTGLSAALLACPATAAADDGGSTRTTAPAAATAPAQAGKPASAVGRGGAARSVGRQPGTAVRPAAAVRDRVRASQTASAAPKSAVKAATVAAAVAASPALAPPAPNPLTVDPAKYAGTYYEQGSVKQFFSIGLVNTKAVYTLKPDGTIRVQNSGNYFVNRGPLSKIVGSAVAVNSTNTELKVGFGPLLSSATPPGNYTILARADDYSWVIVSDPSLYTGYILTRSQTIPPEAYQQLLGQAQSLGVRGRIKPTAQYPR